MKFSISSVLSSIALLSQLAIGNAMECRPCTRLDKAENNAVALFQTSFMAPCTPGRNYLFVDTTELTECCMNIQWYTFGSVAYPAHIFFFSKNSRVAKRSISFNLYKKQVLKSVKVSKSTDNIYHYDMNFDFVNDNSVLPYLFSKGYSTNPVQSTSTNPAQNVKTVCPAVSTQRANTKKDADRLKREMAEANTRAEAKRRGSGAASSSTSSGSLPVPAKLDARFNGATF